MECNKVLSPQSSSRILLIADKKVIGIGRYAISRDSWFGVQVISGEIYDKMVTSKTGNILPIENIFPRFLLKTGVYIDSGLMDAEDIDDLFKNIRAVHEFHLMNGLVPDSFGDVEGYPSKYVDL